MRTWLLAERIALIEVLLILSIYLQFYYRLLLDIIHCQLKLLMIILGLVEPLNTFMLLNVDIMEVLILEASLVKFIYEIVTI